MFFNISTQKEQLVLKLSAIKQAAWSMYMSDQNEKPKATVQLYIFPPFTLK